MNLEKEQRWHTHPLGQTLIVLSGVGLAQREGGAIGEIRPGNIVWIAPGENIGMELLQL